MSFERPQFVDYSGSTVTQVTTQYGPRTTDQSFGAGPTTKGTEREVVWVIDVAKEITGAPTTSNALIAASTNKMVHTIPAYAKVKEFRVEVLEQLLSVGGSAAATGATTALTFGLEQEDGTDIDLDGLLDATDGALAVAANDVNEARGEWKMGGSAALVPDYGSAATPAETVSIGANAGQLYGLLLIDDVTGMTSISGKLRCVLTYTAEGPGGA